MKKLFTLCTATLLSTGLFAGECGNWGVRAEAIYWQAYTDGLEYALFDRAVANAAPLPTQPFATDFQLKEAELDTSWGFKLGLDYTFDCLCWTVDALWTRYRADGSDEIARTEVSDGPGLIGDDANDIWMLFRSNAPEAIRGKNTLDYDTIDVTLQRALCDCGWMYSRVLFGVRGAVIKDKLDVLLIGGGTADYGGDLIDICIHNDFCGAGPTIGFAPYVPLMCGLSLEGYGAISALYGEFDLDQSQRSAFDVDAKRHINRIQPNIDLGLYLNWCTDLCCFPVEFTIGYEVNYWINFVRQNRYVNFGPNEAIGGENDLVKYIQQRQGDLVLHGLNLGVNVRF